MGCPDVHDVISNFMNRLVRGKMPKGIYQRQDPEIRFWLNVKKGSGCWEWMASRDVDGYGLFRLGKITRKAHRAAYYFATGERPESVLHKCDNPPCVRFGHLFSGDTKINMADARAKGRGPCAARLARNTCPSGHPYFGTNLYINKHGWRQCKTCTNRSSMLAHRKERSLCPIP